MQLPILLSFAFLRYLMGWVFQFFLIRIFPLRLQKLVQWPTLALGRIAFAMNLTMLVSAVGFSIPFLETWKENAKHERPPKELICSQFACTRVQGLASGIAMLSMLVQSDPLALALCLSTLKAVSDGSVWVLVLSACTLAACNHFHYSKPRVFFAFLYLTNIFYSVQCYADDDPDDQRISASVSSVCFASLFLVFCVVQKVLRRLKAGALYLIRLPKKLGRQLFGKRD